VELPVEGVIASVRVQGIVDLLDLEGRIIDFKTAARRPVGITPDYSLQLTTYSMITPGASGILQTGHRHEDQDRRTGAAGLRNRSRRTPVC
jgi:hypothetical protein